MRSREHAKDIDAVTQLRNRMSADLLALRYRLEGVELALEVLTKAEKERTDQ